MRDGLSQVSLVYNKPYSASVRARTHCDLMVLSKADYQTITAVYPEGCALLFNYLRATIKYLMQLQPFTTYTAFS